MPESIDGISKTLKCLGNASTCRARCRGPSSYIYHINQDGISMTGPVDPEHATIEPREAFVSSDSSRRYCASRSTDSLWILALQSQRHRSKTISREAPAKPQIRSPSTKLSRMKSFTLDRRKPTGAVSGKSGTQKSPRLQACMISSLPLFSPWC